MSGVFNFDSHGDSQGERCRRLWCQVLVQMLQDAFGLSAQHDRDMTQAQSFCLSGSPAWKQEREIVLSLAGIDADYFTKKVRELANSDGPILQARAPPPVRPSKRRPVFAGKQTWRGLVTMSANDP